MYIYIYLSTYPNLQMPMKCIYPKLSKKTYKINYRLATLGH